MPIVSQVDIIRIFPEVLLALTGILIMLADSFVPRGQKGVLGQVALVGVVAALLGTIIMAGHPGTSFNRMIVVDSFSVFLHFLLLVIAGLTILASFRYLDREQIHFSEYYALILFGTIGMGIMASANELVLIFLGLETSSIATYVLVGFRRNVLRSNEAAMKYFLLGSFAMAFLLFGVSMMYGATGSTFLPNIRAALRAGESNPTLVWMGIGLMFVGFGFKVAAAPLQVWTPDVYEGAATPVTAFLSSGPKAAAFAVFLRVFFSALLPEQAHWFWLIWASAVLTMFVGNLAALVQSNIKRMLAYSSIAQAGYILVAFAASSDLGIAAALFYLVAYALMKLGAFSVVAHFAGAGEKRLEIDDYAGLGARHPLLAACFSIFLLSLVGIPLTSGFFGKFYIFKAALNSAQSSVAVELRPWLLWLVILGVLNSAISIYYYLRVIVVMYMKEPPAELEVAPVPSSLGIVLLLTALGTIYLGVLPGTVLSFATQSALGLR